MTHPGGSRRHGGGAYVRHGKHRQTSPHTCLMGGMLVGRLTVSLVYLYRHSRDDLELRVLWKESTHPSKSATDQAEHSCSNRKAESSLWFGARAHTQMHEN